MPTVSVVMPVWRPRAEFLRPAILSALAQSDCELEVIVVDNGNTEPLQPCLARLDGRVRVVRQEHTGVSGALNAGQAAAQGEYLRFTAADDVLDPGSTGRLLELLAGRTDAVAYGATIYCDRHLRPVWKMASQRQGWLAEDTLLNQVKLRVQAMLFPRAVIARTGEWARELTVSMDWDYVLRAFEHAPAVGDQRTAFYYRRHPNAHSRDFEAGIRDGRRIVGRYFERHPEQRGRDLERRARAMLDAREGRVLAARGRWLRAAPRLAHSLREEPGALLEEMRHALPGLRGAAASRLGLPQPGLPPPPPLPTDPGSCWTGGR